MEQKAVIFDLDGLLIDSEPIWEESEQSVFKRYEVNVLMEWCHQIKGNRVDEAVKSIIRLSNRSDLDALIIEQQIVAEVIRLIGLKAKGMPGYMYILHFFKSRGWLVSLASASKMPVIEAALAKLGCSALFDEIHSAEFEEFGKPHPAVFLTTADKLGVKPQNCLVFEDSINGMIAGKAARMKVVAIPPVELINDVRYSLADAILPTLLAFKEMNLVKLAMQ